MILKQTALKTLLFSGMLISQTTFGTAQTSASTPFAQPQLQEQTSQQAPQEKQDEYLFKKKFRELPFGYTPLMFLYAIANGSISEEIKFAASDNSIAPFALETIDFIYDEIEDKHKDIFEWFLENLARLLTIYGTELFTNTSSKSIKLHKLSLCDGSLEEFQKGGSSAARGVIKTILRAFLQHQYLNIFLIK